MNRILLVEDDPGIVKSLTEFLNAEGFQVASASGQTAAIQLFDREPFDLVLLDVSLSEGNGFATCASLKSRSTVPVIFLTASGDEGSTVAGLDIGADDYIAKPFRPRELVSRIRNSKTTRRSRCPRWNTRFCSRSSPTAGECCRARICSTRSGTWQAIS